MKEFSKMMRQQWHKAALVVAIVAVSGAAIIGVILDNAEATEVLTTDYRALDGHRLAEAYLRGIDSGNGTSSSTMTSTSPRVVTISGYAVTSSEFLSQKEAAIINNTRMENALNRIIPDEGFSWNTQDVPDDVSFNYANYTLPESTGIRDLYQPRLELFNIYGADAIALGLLIYKYGLLNAASTAGHTVSEAELNAQVDTIRALVYDSADPLISSYIATIGDATYWNAIATHMRHELVIEKWLNSLGTNKEQNILSAVSDAQVDIVDSRVVGSSVTDARAFLRASLKLMGISAPTPTPTATPTPLN